MRHRLFVTLLLAGVSADVVTAATTRYVRKDGNAACTGLADAPWDRVCVSSCPCAKGTIAQGRSVLASGDTLLIHGGGGDYKERIVWSAEFDAETTIRGYGPVPPVIGRITTYARDRGWTLHDAATQTYRRGGWDDSVNTAYLVPEADYENGRVGLVLYESLAWLMAPPLDAAAPADAPYYIGPGVWVDETEEILYIRLQADTDPGPGLGPVHDYQLRYIDLGIGSGPGRSENPADFVIKLATDDYTFRVNGSRYTFDNLTIEGTVELCSDGEEIERFTLTNSTVWASRRGAVRVYSDEDAEPPVTCTSRDVTLRGNSFLWDIPYWVSWVDAKADLGDNGRRRAYGLSRSRLIMLTDDANRWTIERNLIRGGHDGIGSNGSPHPEHPDLGGHTDDIVVAYNRIENFHDDPIEIEGDHVGRWDVYGNVISNSLNCFSSGQQTTDFVGPVHYHSNICTLTRPPFVSRTGQTASWNGGRAYGNAGAFKMEDDDSVNPVHMYQNTTILLDSHPDRGMDFISGKGKAAGMEFFNNVFIKVNGRAGQKQYPSLSDPGEALSPRVVDWNLYRSLNNDPGGGHALLDAHPTTSQCSDDTWGCRWEEHGLGGSPSTGTNPGLVEWGWGCMDPESPRCDGFDESDPNRWALKPGSQYWDPAALIPAAGSALCGAGRGSLASPEWPAHPPTPAGSAFNPSDIGAIPCGTTPDAFDTFPFNAGWTTPRLASGRAPQFAMTHPDPGTQCPLITDLVDSVYFCGKFDADEDGGAPMTVRWRFLGPECPEERNEICPGHVSFKPGIACLVVFTVTDRWGMAQEPPPTCFIRPLHGTFDERLFWHSDIP